MTERHLASEVAKFAVIGIVNTALDVALFNALLFSVFEHEPWAAKAISTTVSATASYFMNRHWTWAHRQRTGAYRELPLFLVISALALGIIEGCLLLSHYGFGLASKLDDNISANLIGLPLATVFRFWAFKRFVFLHPDARARFRRAPGDGRLPALVPGGAPNDRVAGAGHRRLG